MESYYVVKCTKEKDELFTVIDAESLEEVQAIFRIRYKEEVEKMGSGDSFYFFSAKEELKFDESNRLIFPDGGMIGMHSI